MGANLYPAMNAFSRVACALFLSLFTVSACAAVPEVAVNSTMRAYQWHDGAQLRTVWLNPALWMEFNASEGSKASVLNAVPAASVMSEQGDVRYWKVPESDLIPRTTAVLSEVFHVAPDPSAPALSLPGNVLITLQSGWDLKTVNAWFAAHRLKPVKQLDMSGNVWVIQSPPGLASLTLANQLAETAGVVNASPNWWRPAALK